MHQPGSFNLPGQGRLHVGHPPPPPSPPPRPPPPPPPPPPLPQQQQERHQHQKREEKYRVAQRGAARHYEAYRSHHNDAVARAGLAAVRLHEEIVLSSGSSSGDSGSEDESRSSAQRQAQQQQQHRQQWQLQQQRDQWHHEQQQLHQRHWSEKQQHCAQQQQQQQRQQQAQRWQPQPQQQQQRRGPNTNLARSGPEPPNRRDQQAHPSHQHQQEEHEQQRQPRQRSQDQQLRQQQPPQNQGQRQYVSHQQRPQRGTQYLRMDYASAGRSLAADSTDTLSSSSSSSSSSSNMNFGWGHSVHAQCSRLLPEFRDLIKWRSGQMQKALRIVSAEDGVRVHEDDPDTFIVASDSANCRLVDAAVCECSCPNPTPPCSHLLAVALWRPQRQKEWQQAFRLRLAISTFVKQQLLRVATESFVPLKPLTNEVLLDDLYQSLLRRHSAAVAARAAAGLAVGLLLRFAQNAQESLPHISLTARRGAQENAEVESVLDDEEEGGTQSHQQAQQEQRQQEQEEKWGDGCAADAAESKPKAEIEPVQEPSTPLASEAASSSSSYSNSSIKSPGKQVRECGHSVSLEVALPRLMQELQRQQQALREGTPEDVLKQLHSLETAALAAGASSGVGTLLQLLQRDEARDAAAAVEELLQSRAQASDGRKGPAVLAEETVSVEVYVHFAALLLEAASAAAAAAAQRQGGAHAPSAAADQWLRQLSLRLVDFHFPPAAAAALQRSKPLADAASLRKFVAALQATLTESPKGNLVHAEGSQALPQRLLDLWGEQPLPAAVHETVAAELRRYRSSGIRPAAAICDPWRLAEALTVNPRISFNQQQQQQQQQETPHVTVWRDQGLHLLLSKPKALQQQQQQQHFQSTPGTSWQAVVEQIEGAPFLVDLCSYLSWPAEFQPHFGTLDSFLSRHGHAPFAAASSSCSSSSSFRSLSDKSFFVASGFGEILRVPKPSTQTLQSLLHAISSKNASAAVVDLASLLWQPERGHLASTADLARLSANPVPLQAQIRGHLEQLFQQQRQQQQQQEQEVQLWGNFCCQILAEAPRALVDSLAVVVVLPLCAVFGGAVLHAAIAAFVAAIKGQHERQQEGSSMKPPLVDDHLQLQLLFTRAAFIPLSCHMRAALGRCAQLLLPPEELSGALRELQQQQQQGGDQPQGQLAQAQQACTAREDMTSRKDCDACSSRESSELIASAEAPAAAVATPQRMVLEEGYEVLLTSFERLRHAFRPQGSAAQEWSSSTPTASTAATSGTTAAATVAETQDETGCWSGESPEAFVLRLRAEEFGVGFNSSSSSGGKDKAVDAVMRRQRERLTRALGRLAGDLYASEGHLQLELLQNADDNCYILPLKLPPLLQLQNEQHLRLAALQVPALHFELLPGGLCVFNNERGFSPKDLRSLCDVARSTKDPQQQQQQQGGGGRRRIGRFGVGFKSVFSLSDEPHVFSRTGVAVKFSATDSSGLGFVLPHLLDRSDPSRYIPPEALIGALLAAADPSLPTCKVDDSNLDSSVCCCPDVTRSATEKHGGDSTEAAGAAATAEAAISIWRTIIWLPVRPTLRDRWLGGDGGLVQRLSVVEPHCILFLRQICRVSARSSLAQRCFLLSKQTFSHINLASFLQQSQQPQQQLTQRQQVIPLPAHAQHVLLTSRVRRLNSNARNSCDLWGGCGSKEGDFWQQRRHHWLLVQHTLKGSSPPAGPCGEPLIVALPLTPDGFAAASPAAAAGDSSNSSNSSNSSSGSGGDSVGWPVHCFLPVRGFGLPFILQGSFNLTASREDLRCGDPWNEWLLQQLPAAVLAALSACRDAHPQLQESLLLFAPLLTAGAAGGGSAAMVAAAAEAAVNGLKDLDCLIAVSPQCSTDDCVQRPRQQQQQSSEDCIWCCPRRAVLPCDLEEGEGEQALALVAPESERSSISSSSSRAGIAGLIPPWLLQEALGLLYVHPRVLRHVNSCVLRTLGARDLTLWDVVEVVRFLVSLQQQQEQQEQRPPPSLLQPHWVGRLLLLIDSLLRKRGQQQQQQSNALRVLRSIPFLPTMCGRFAAADAKEAPLCLPDAAAAVDAQGVDATWFFSEAAAAARPGAAASETCSSYPLVMFLHPRVLEPWAAEPARCQQQQEQQLVQQQQESMTQKEQERQQEDLFVAQQERNREDEARLLSDQGLQRSRVLRCLRGIGVESLRPQQLMKQRLLPLLEQHHFISTATESQLVRYLYFFVSNYRDLEVLMQSDHSSSSSSSGSSIRQQVLLLPVCTDKGEKVPLGCISLRALRGSGKGIISEQRLLYLYRELLPELVFLSSAYAEVISLPSWGNFCDLLGLQRLLHVCHVEYRIHWGAVQQQQQQNTDQSAVVPAIEVLSVDGSRVTKGSTNSSSSCSHEELFQFLRLRWLGATWPLLQDELLHQGSEALDSCLAGRVSESAGVCLLFEDFVCPDFEKLVASAAAATSCCRSEWAAAPNRSLLLLPSQRIRQVSRELQQAEALSLRLLIGVLTEAQSYWQPYRSLRWSVVDEGYLAAAHSQQVVDGVSPAIQGAPAAVAALRRGASWALSTSVGTAASSLFLQLRCTAWLPAVACDVATAASMASAQAGSSEDTAFFEIDCKGDDTLLRCFSSSSSSSDSESELTRPSGSSTCRSLHKNRKRFLSGERPVSVAPTVSRETGAPRTITTCSPLPGITVTGRSLSVTPNASSDESPCAEGDCPRCRGSSSNESKTLRARWQWRFVGLRRPCDIATLTAECMEVYGRVVEYLHPLAAGLLRQHQQQQEDTGQDDPARGGTSNGDLFALLADPASCLGVLTGRMRTAAGSVEEDEGLRARASHAGASMDEWIKGSLASAAAWLGDLPRPHRAHAATPAAAAAPLASRSATAGWLSRLETRKGLHFAPDAGTAAAVIVSLACMLKEEGRASASTATAEATSGATRGDFEARDIGSISCTSMSFDKGFRVIAPKVATCFFVGAAAACGDRRCCCAEVGYDSRGRELKRCCCLRQHCGGKPVRLFCCCCAAVVADVFRLLQYLALQRHRAASAVEPAGAAPQQGFFCEADAENPVLLPQPCSRIVGEQASASMGGYAGGACCISWRPASQTIYHLPLGAPLHAFPSGWPLEDLALLLRSQRAAFAAADAVLVSEVQVAETQRQFQSQLEGQEQIADLKVLFLRELHVPEYPSPEACVAALLQLTRGFGECAGDAYRRTETAVAAVHMQQQALLPAVGAPVRPHKFRRFEAQGDDSFMWSAGAPGAAATNSRGKSDNVSAVCMQVMSLLLHLHIQRGTKGLLALIEDLNVVPCLKLSSSLGRTARSVSPACGTAAAAATATASARKLQVAFLPAGGPLWLQLTPADCRLWDLLRAPPSAASTGARGEVLVAEQSRNLEQRQARDSGRRPGNWAADEASSSFVFPHVVWCCEASCGVEDLILAAAASDCRAATAEDAVSCPLCGPCFAYRQQLQLQHHQHRQRGETLQAWLELLQHELGAEPLHSVCAIQLACALPPFVGSEARDLELIPLGSSLGHPDEEGAGVLMRGLKERLLLVLLPAVRRYLLKHDPTRYASLHQQWLAARQRGADRDAGTAHAAEAGCSSWLPQVQRLLLVLCRNLRRRVCHLPSGATGSWTSCAAALQWEGLLEGGGELPALSADVSSKSASKHSNVSSNTSNVAKENELTTENRWESAEANASEAPFLLACSIEDQMLVTQLLMLEQVTTGSRNHGRLADLFFKARADNLQELLLPALPDDTLEELSRLFSLTGGADGALAAFLSLLYSKLQHRLLQWLLRNCSEGLLHWLQQLQRHSSSSSCCCYSLTTVAVASIVESALAEYLKADGLWGDSLECEELQQCALAGSEVFAENSPADFSSPASALLSSAASTKTLRQKLLVLLKEEGEAAAERSKDLDGMKGGANEGGAAWLLRDAWFVLSMAGTPAPASGTPSGSESSEPAAAGESAAAALAAEAAGEAVAASDDATAEGGRANIARKKHRRRVSAASEGSRAVEGEELLVAAARAEYSSSSSSSSSWRSVSSDSSSEVEEVVPEKGLGWGDDKNLRDAAREVSSLRREALGLESNRQDLFGALHPAGKDTAGGVSSVYAGEGRDKSRQAAPGDIRADNPLVALGDFEAQVVDIDTQDREAAAPFVAGPSTNTSTASAVAGRRGEALVYAYLQRQLQQQLADRTAQVLWLNEEQESGQSYDILIKEYPPVGTAAPPSMTFVEVKSSLTADKSYFEISHREWNLAQQHGDRFHIYRVLQANSNYPQIFRIVNPYMQWKKKCIGLCIAI
ncbi:hypothetical protein Esti_001063 [Eimeria stiedai]